MNNFKKQLLLALLSYVSLRGQDAGKVCHASGIELTDLQNNDLEISRVTEHHLWINASSFCQDPMFGLHFGESLRLSALGAIGEMIKTNSTIREAIQGALSLVPLITDDFRMQLMDNNHAFKILLIDAKPDQLTMYKAMLADFLIAFTLHELDGLVLQRIQPKSISYPYNPTSSKEYERVLRCPVSVGENFEIELPCTILQIPLISADRELHTFYVQQVEKQLKEKDDKDLSSRIRKYLYGNSYQTLLSLNDVASNFNITPRTLQRRLQSEGTNFQKIAEEVRKSMAVELIGSKKYAVKEISSILGYNEISAFSRAFKKWTGRNAGDFD